MTAPAKSEIIAAFRAAFPDSGPPRIFRAPGRINLIGEHTDYNLGFVCPTALDMACFAAAAPGSNGMLRVRSENQRDTRRWAIADLPHRSPAGDWSDYVCGVAQQVLRVGHKIEPLDLLILSTVPVGAGLSSSAALEVSTALALLGGPILPPLELALLARRAENEFVGVPCGIMDQYVSVFGHEHAAVKLDCRDLTHEIVPVPHELEILAVNTMVKHELGQSAYRERVRECAAAVELLHQRDPEVESLRDASIELVAGLNSVAPENVFRRARHVVTEDLRVNDFVGASSRGDLRKMGELLFDSHHSLRDDYQVSCEELDFLVDAAAGIKGVWGARMTGGGFGGCTVNLVDPHQAGHFRKWIAQAYEQRYHIVPEIYSCRPSAGAGEI